MELPEKAVVFVVTRMGEAGPVMITVAPAAAILGGPFLLKPEREKFQLA